MHYEIKLSSFQGPLDLLLHLIEKNKVDIYDIPISQITIQYMEYIEQWGSLNLDIASEFLVMAATLLEIKSRLLLPSKEESDEQLTLDEEDPRQDLIEKLLEYKKYKMMSMLFKDREKKEVKVVYKDPEYYPEFQDIKQEIDIEADLLYKAFKNILLKMDSTSQERKMFHEIHKEIYRVEDKMVEISMRIKEGNSIQFSTLFYQCNTRNELITIFLALLELIKTKEITIDQKNLFDDFFIMKP